jgi:hypothetical protein
MKTDDMAAEAAGDGEGRANGRRRVAVADDGQDALHSGPQLLRFRLEV